MKAPARYALAALITAALLVSACSGQSLPTTRTVPREGDWGIYAFDLSTQDVALIWSANEAISHLCLNHAGDEFAFSRRVGGTLESNEEIFTIGVNGAGLRQLTDNGHRDLYPCYSPDDSRIAFLSWRNPTLDICVLMG